MNGNERKTEPRESMSGLRDTTLELRFSAADAIMLWDLLAMLPAKLKTDEYRKKAIGLFNRYQAELRRVLQIDSNMCCCGFLPKIVTGDTKEADHDEQKGD